MNIRTLPNHQFVSFKKGSFFIQIAFIFLTIVFCLPAALAFQIDWQKDVTAALTAGKKAHKYALVDVYTDWCGWCKKLDRDTFSDPDLIRFLESKFVCIKANAEDDKSGGKKLAGEYGVNGYPCALVFDPDGKLIGRVEAYRDAQAYEAALTKILDNQNK